MRKYLLPESGNYYKANLHITNKLSVIMTIIGFAGINP